MDLLKLGSGQTSHPNGLWYRGAEESWSRETLTGIFDTYLGTASRLVLLDFHTALGRYRQTTVLIKDEEKRKQVREWVETKKKLLQTPDVYVRDQPRNSPCFYSLPPWFAERYKERDVFSATIEFGVKASPLDILLKLRDETWVHTCK